MIKKIALKTISLNKFKLKIRKGRFEKKDEMTEKADIDVYKGQRF